MKTAARPPLVMVCAREGCVRPATRLQMWGFSADARLTYEALCWAHYDWWQAVRVWVSVKYWRARHRLHR